ncbi:MAG: DUF2958 domain-containing protein [Pseudomonadota bacterium]
MQFAELFGGMPPPAHIRRHKVKLANNARLLAAIESIRAFVPPSQLEVMVQGCSGEESGFFETAIYDLNNTIIAMPITYDQENLGDQAVVHLHYFINGADWHITEQDANGGGTQQAFGLANLGYGAELGYISIDELCSIPGMQLDLHWEPITLEAVKAGA